MSSLKITFNGTDYVLQFSRKTVKEMESRGYHNTGDALLNAPVSSFEALFSGAFLMHQPRMKEEDKRAIWKGLSNKDDLVEALVKLYQEPLESFMDDPDENVKKATWVMVDEKK